MKKVVYLLLLFWIPFLGFAQLVTTEPALLTDKSAAVLTFDASTTGLNNYEGTDVYAHTGVITDRSTSGSDWRYGTDWNTNDDKYKMEPLGNNKWKLTISPSIREFYSVPNEEKINQLAFVFRNGDGSREGKDNGKDIFLPVYQEGLNIQIEIPTGDLQINKNTATAIKANSSQPAELKLLLDEVPLATNTNATSIEFTYSFPDEGNFWLIAEAQTAVETKRDSLRVFVKKEQTTQELPAGVRSGINYIDETTVTFVLYAPGKESVFLIGDFNDWQLNNNYWLAKDGDYWWITLSDLVKGQEYAFQYVVDGTLKMADPYTDKILDPWNDSYIEASVYPDLKEYPSGKTDGIVSVVQTGQTPYNWKTTSFTAQPREKLVIYEMLIRDFTEEHSFNAALGKLDYLQTLGINAIELMPVNEFEGNSSWGYNPSFYFAVDKYYGTKNDFKKFVDECHQRGIAVIMDMVLNHSYGQSPFVRLYWDEAAQQPAADNPWYNQSAPNTDYSWGYDFNHESKNTEALVDSINSYWMKEYKVDGFRFDFTKGFTNTPGNGWVYDESRITILKRMANEIYKRNPEAFVIMEHLTDNSEEKVLADDADIMLWGNMNNNYCQAAMGWLEGIDLSQAVYTTRGWTKPNLISYMESHDEERVMYKAMTWGNGVEGYEIKNNLPLSLERAGVAAAFYLTLPGPKMIWQFGELGYDYSINACPDGSTSEGCRTDPKAIRWDYLEDPDRKALYDTYSRLIKLKSEHDFFNSKEIAYQLNGYEKSIVWKGTDENAFLIGNFDVVNQAIEVTIPKSGTWYNALTGEETTISSTDYSVTLKPGEYRLYTDKKEGNAEPPVNYLQVTLPTVENVETQPAAGSYQVAERGDFTFTAAPVSSHSKDTLVITTNRSADGTLVPNGTTYTVKDIREAVDIRMTLKPYKDPVGNETLNAGITVWASDGMLHISVEKPEIVSVFTASGQLIYKAQLPAGKSSRALSSGMYIVNIDGKSTKIIN